MVQLSLLFTVVLGDISFMNNIVVSGYISEIFFAGWTVGFLCFLMIIVTSLEQKKLD